MAIQDNNKLVTRILLIGLAVAILLVLFVHYRQQVQQQKKEKFSAAAVDMEMEDDMMAPRMEPFSQTIGSVPAKYAMDAPLVGQEQTEVKPSEPLGNDSYKAVDFATESKMPNGCFPRDKLTAQDLLPKDAANSKWAQVAPAGQGDVQGQNFLTAGYMSGIDTVGQTLRNANYQIRSDPPVPRFPVGPWNQSTIEYDNNRRPLEIGSSC